MVETQFVTSRAGTPELVGYTDFHDPLRGRPGSSIGPVVTGPRPSPGRGSASDPVITCPKGGKLKQVQGDGVYVVNFRHRVLSLKRSRNPPMGQRPPHVKPPEIGRAHV